MEGLGSQDRGPATGGRIEGLDGLRGVAVLAVVASHLTLPFVRYGGATGVGLFFVLSGYLITTLLMTERSRHGRISLLAFHARRALRLLPAMALAVGVGTILAIADGRPAGAVAKHALVTVAYLGNITPVLGVTAAGPFAHMWTLALEEQFYVVWPLVIVGLRRWATETTLLVVALAVAAISLVWRYAGPITTRAGFDRAYVYPQANAYALAFGCALALWLRGRVVTLPTWAWSVAIGVFAAASCIPGLRYGLYEEASSYSRVARLACGTTGALAAVILVAVVVTASPFGRWLTHPVLLFTGRISYGLYLWHELLTDLLSDHLGDAGARGLMAGTIGAVLAYGVAVVSYRYVETPFLRGKTRFERVDSALIGPPEPSGPDSSGPRR